MTSINTKTTVTPRPGITFPVDPVTPATKPLKEIPAHEALRMALDDADIESCSDYHSKVVAGLTGHPLLAAVVKAFAEHRPLVLSPDAVWLTIAQGVAHHMAIHGERLRSRFVSHEGKIQLTFEVKGWVDGSPENPWVAAFAGWSSMIRAHVGPTVHDLLSCDFSTTTPVERAVSDVVMMDVFQRYFHYRLLCICGIPTVTLEGTPDDWTRLRDKANGLSLFDMDWWLAHLLPICDQFARASRGDVDTRHWREICQLEDQYGGAVITGWVAKLFPYIRSFRNGPCRLRNPVFETSEGFIADYAPSGLSRVPFIREHLDTGRKQPMEAVAGLVGVSQDVHTLALRPNAGWAIKPADEMDVLLHRIELDHTTFPAAQAIDLDTDRRKWSMFIPPDLGAFYSRTDGAELFGRGADAACRILPREEMLASSEGMSDWLRLARLRDGSWLAINFNPPVPAGGPLWREWDTEKPFTPIRHLPAERWRSCKPVIAFSVTDFLTRFLDADGKAYWEEKPESVQELNRAWRFE